MASSAPSLPTRRLSCYLALSMDSLSRSSSSYLDFFDLPDPLLCMPSTDLSCPKPGRPQASRQLPAAAAPSSLSPSQEHRRGSVDFPGSVSAVETSCHFAASQRLQPTGIPAIPPRSTIRGEASEVQPPTLKPLTNLIGVDEQPTQAMISDEKKSSVKMKSAVPRIAIKTKSSVDVLDDGFKWRKYGQKAVKNCRYPRCYYRCSESNCTIKKRVQRLEADPEYVVTTYEGMHNHPVSTQYTWSPQ